MISTFRVAFYKAFVSGFLLTSGGVTFAQSDVETAIKVSTLLANIPVIINDKDGRHVAGLKPADFRVTSGGVPNEIVYFSDAQMPLSVAILLDETGSVRSVLGGIKRAAKQFINQLGPEDHYLVVTFGVQLRPNGSKTSQ